MATVNEKMTAIAGAIRNKTGSTSALNLDQMASELNAIADNDSSDLTASGATVSVPAGNYKTAASKSVATATQATPSVSIDSAGQITATATQTAGYVEAGTKTDTLQLTTQAAQTITPGTTDQTIVSGQYLIGTQTIKGDANLTANNIAEGVSIFGVTGTHSGGSGTGDGIDTSDATATAEDIVEGETAYVNGVKLTGTNPYEKTATDTQVNTQADLLSQVIAAIAAKAAPAATYTIHIGPAEPTADIGSDGDIYIVREASV